MFGTGDNGIDFSGLAELFADNALQETPPVDEVKNPADDGGNQSTESQIENTKAFAKRLSEKSEKVRLEEREKIAKEFGYETYESMVKEREKKMLEDKGLTSEEVAPIVEELVNKRINDDPRMKELSELRKKRTEEFAEQELAKLKQLTDGAISSFNQIPKDVVDEWTKTGSLTGSYMKLHGEELLNKVKSGQSNGSTSHLQTPDAGANMNTNKRPLTNDEKKMWKFFNPRMTDEELSKVMVDK